MSDLHIGAVDCDKDLIRSDLEWAKRHKAIALINGDLCDLILPKDSKRFNPANYDPLISKTNNVLNNTLDLADKLLSPYAESIMMVGEGNHETSVQKYHSVDFNALLVERLQASSKSKVHRGGYTGAVVVPFCKPKGNNGLNLNIWYHHGTGGASPVTKGMIDFNRISTYISNAHVLWMGHKHNRFVDTAAVLHIPPKGGEFRRIKQYRIMTGAYTGEGTPQFDADGYYQTDWARERGFAPQGKGGVKLTVHVVRSEKEVRLDINVSL